MTERKGVEIDYCTKCRGVWLDRGELDKIIELSVEEMMRQSQQLDHEPETSAPTPAVAESRPTTMGPGASEPKRSPEDYYPERRESAFDKERPSERKREKERQKELDKERERIRARERELERYERERYERERRERRERDRYEDRRYKEKYSKYDKKHDKKYYDKYGRPKKKKSWLSEMFDIFD